MNALTQCEKMNRSPEYVRLETLIRAEADKFPKDEAV